MVHPRLGRLTLTDGSWHGFAALPLFAARGQELDWHDRPPPGTVAVSIDAYDRSPISPQQEGAIAGLLDREAAILAAVWAELAPEFPSSDLVTEVGCFEVEVSSAHLGGVAWLAFSIEGDALTEHGFQVAYHPTGGTFWGDWEALSGLEAHQIDE